MKTPAWARLLSKVSRGLNSVDVAQQIVRDELLFAFVPPSQRDGFTFDAYSKSRVYGQGGDYFLDGLFAWEAAILDDSRVPRSGRVLLGAAGGGRELQALIARGYDVDAFEPVAPLLESAVAVARGTRSTVVQAAYQDLVARAVGRSGPLDPLSGPFDLCLFGWGSMSHLTEPSDVVATLRAVRTLAPRAPVIASFLLRSGKTPALQGGARTLRYGLRGLLAASGGRPVPDGIKFGTSYGFFYEFSRGELTDLCAQAGYEIAVINELPHPHALFLPSDGEVD